MKYTYTCSEGDCAFQTIVETDMTAPKKTKCRKCGSTIKRDDLKNEPDEEDSGEAA